MDKNILECSSLTKTFTQGENIIYAVNSCNLKIESGSFTAIYGASGSGKTTLLHLLSALDNPTSGNVFINGKDIHKMNDADVSKFRKNEIGFIFQNFNLLPILTAEENIMMAAASNPSFSKIYFDEICEHLGIKNRLHHMPHELSGGQQQRTAVARALINRPKIVFADEPTGNLDRKSASELIALLSSSNKSFGQTILMVTHDVSISETADTVYNMEDGVLTRIK